jgi:uncharacterized protein
MFEPSRKIVTERERTRLNGVEAPRAGLRQPLLVALGVTLVATALSYLLPSSWAATGVGFTFLFASYWLVVRGDDTQKIRGFGLSLGGLLEPEPLSAARIWHDARSAIFHALLAAAIIYPFFWLGFRIWWNVGPIHPAPLGELPSMLVIALPEEAFYRGYLQTSLERGLNRSVTVFGTRLGWGIVATSAIFAVGHLLTELNPARLAVFFPSLVFGLLRARTGGIGASILFHALCNLFSWYLIRSYF